MFGKKYRCDRGKKALQGLFIVCTALSVYGMNYGNGDVLHSGETNARVCQKQSCLAGGKRGIV